MNWTFVRDFHQLGALFVGQRSGEMNVPPNAIDSSFLRFTIIAIARVDL